MPIKFKPPDLEKISIKAENGMLLFVIPASVVVGALADLLRVAPEAAIGIGKYALRSVMNNKKR